ncbi:MAG: DUF1003 domain-containing protein [Armatimonadetes bacterium]|nr:DUF1003 domain-containing protein [Armatimonadota bacterium]
MITTNFPERETANGIPCPACGVPHPPADIFCPHCGKAVGGLPYIREEFEGSRRQYERFADAVTHFVSAPSYFGVHLFWVAAWILLNSGAVMAIHRFDPPPSFDLLSLLLSVEAIFLTGFLLVSQNREVDYERKRAELEYENTVQTNRLLGEIHLQLATIANRVERIESDLRIER